MLFRSPGYYSLKVDANTVEMFGTGEVDVFEFTLADPGDSSYTVFNFDDDIGQGEPGTFMGNSLGNDVLDISDLLVGAEAEEIVDGEALVAAGLITSITSVAGDTATGDTVINVVNEGVATTITVDNTDFVGAQTDLATIIDQMLAAGMLITTDP